MLGVFSSAQGTEKGHFQRNWLRKLTSSQIFSLENPANREYTGLGNTKSRAPRDFLSGESCVSTSVSFGEEDWMRFCRSAFRRYFFLYSEEVFPVIFIIKLKYENWVFWVMKKRRRKNKRTSSPPPLYSNSSEIFFNILYNRFTLWGATLYGKLKLLPHPYGTSYAFTHFRLREHVHVERLCSVDRKRSGGGVRTKGW